MPKILTVYTKNGAVIGNYDYVGAAYLLDIDEGELAWAIEEHGRCDGNDGIAIPHGEPFESHKDWVWRTQNEPR